MVAGRSWTDDFRKQIIRSANEIALRYAVDEDHARHVAELSQMLFRELRREHQLSEHYETLLYVAALLHETGGYINTSSLHKHSMYIIQNSELFGLTAEDVQIVALVARYHRRALPKPTHQPYNSLDRDKRVIIAKLAAILRIGLCLDASRSQRVKKFSCAVQGSRLIISVPNVDDLSVEQLAVRQERTFFDAIFGLQVQIRPQARVTVSEPSAQL
jgi:exopolyphosphatase/guanosine-5'-triphosphate,3'-diphosphate pyrophosphatase